MNQAAILLQLLRLPQVGPAKLRLILARLFQIGVPPERILELSDQQLLLDVRLKPEQVEALRNPPSDAEEDLRHCAEEGIRVLLSADAHYPIQLLNLLGRTAPPLIFARGNLDLLKYPALGISGSRQAREESLSAVLRLSQSVAAQGWVVVSGGARGVDTAAHLGCMEDGPGTIVVMPTGILKPNLRREIKKHFEDGKTLLLSEFPPEYGWTVGCAMQRNRLLAALSRVVALVEPGLRGGTGGTGRIALRIGLPVFVLRLATGVSSGEEDLMKAGARPLNPDQLSPQEITRLFSQAHEACEANRDRLQTEKLFSA